MTQEFELETEKYQINSGYFFIIWEKRNDF